MAPTKRGTPALPRRSARSPRSIALISNYRPDSELSTVNRRASHEPVVVSDALLSVLGAAEVVSARSHGAFDVTVGPLMRLWGLSKAAARA